MMEPLVLSIIAILALAYCIIKKYIEKRAAVQRLEKETNRVVLLLE